EAMAEPGRAYLTENTARLVEDWFNLEGIGPVDVKGARMPVRVSLLGTPVSPSTRRKSGMSPLVGRDRELAVMEDALTMAMEGQAQVVGVVGEAGVGKSRLCEEFAELATARGVTVRRAAGISHGQQVPLLPILALQREYFEITDADSTEEARVKIAERLLGLDPDLETILPLMFDFLEVPDPARPAPPMAPEVRMRRILDAVRRITARRSERETLVLLFEDLHWFDAQSKAFLERLIESYPGSRTVVLANFRPEFSAAWMRHSYYRQLALGPLQNAAVDELLGQMLGSDPSLRPLLELVAERTGGNPFFLEEVVRGLVHDGMLAGRPGGYRLARPLHEIKVPATVRAVLEARIDGLDRQHKSALQTASVIGRTFGTRLLADVWGPDRPGLEDALSALCAAELLQRVADESTGEYRFWHPLTQEVAYGTLLGGRRAELHAVVAQTLAQDEEHRGERAALIAWHWDQARRPVEAAHWLMEAGAWASRTDLSEADRQWRMAIGLLDGVAENVETQELGIAARARLLQYGARTGLDPVELERLYMEARGLAERSGETKLLAWVVAFSGSGKFWYGQLRAGLARYEEGAALARATGDPDVTAATYFAPTIPLLYMGPLSEALAPIDRYLTVSGENPDRGAAYLGYSPLSRTFDLRSRILLLAGRLPEAAHDLGRSLAIARQREEPDPLCWALSLVARLAWAVGEGDGSEAAAEGVKLAEETGNTAGLVLALESKALSELQTAGPSRAIATCERALAAARERRSGLFEEASVLAHLAAARLAGGDAAGARHAADEGVAVAQRQEARVVECLALLTRAQTWRALDRPADAAVDLQAALVIAENTGALTYEPFIHEEFARLQNRESELHEALRLYRQIGATGHARRLEAELSTRAVR
ncbi:MAG TPA: AAA family ATPase, partial [Acidimicrobiia bacterium]|nr:AAA family ATPase [Acidimicrobiia bacterium]